MGRACIVRPPAEADLDQAARWYDGEEVGLGARFLDDADRVLDRIRDAPLQFPAISGRVRRALLHTFPYAVYFLLTDKAVIVLAVLHLRRNQKVWRGRT